MAACDHGDHGDVEQLAGRRAEPKGGVAGTARRQAQYARRLRAPFGKINAAIRRGIVSEDIFGYHDDAGYATPSIAQNPHATEQLAFDPDDLTPDDFSAGDNPANQRAFMEWLRRQQAEGVLTIIQTDENVYIRRALSDGDRFALDRLQRAGMAVGEGASPEEFLLPGGPRGVGGAMNAPIPANRVRTLFERNYSLLEGITTDLSDEISDVLSQGIAQGQSPSKIARSISDRVQKTGKHRATLLARHEVMYAHNEMAKHRYRDEGVNRVEWLGTSPCTLCEPFVGETYRIGALPQGGPPVHPQCVGTLAPVIE